MPSVTELHVYPVKGLRGIALQRAHAGDRGLEHDRRFMVVDGAGRFLTQRTLPRMSLVAVQLDAGTLRLAAPGMEPLELPLRPGRGERRRVEVWRDRCDAVSLGEAPARWLSRFLGVEVGLVYMPDATHRATDPAFGPGRVGFADAFPFLLTSAASLRDLARRGAEVPMIRFRPNIVVDGAEPFAEDGWRAVRIGGVRFRVAKPCARCSVTTVDPDRGEVAGVEPLHALGTFRRAAEGVLFGVNLVNEGEATIAVGDEVAVEP